MEPSSTQISRAVADGRRELCPHGVELVEGHALSGMSCWEFHRS